LRDRNAAFIRPNTFGSGPSVTYDVEQLKIVYEEMAIKAGVNLLYHAFVPDVLLEEGELRGVVVASKAGLTPVRAQLVIDASGDGDVAARVGVPFELAGTEGRPVQSLTTIFYMANVDGDRALSVSHTEFTDRMREAAKSGRYRLTRIGGSIHRTPHAGLIHANLTRVPNVDATDPFALTRAEIEGRRQAQEYARFLRSEIPGFEHAYLVMTSCHIGVRETRRLVGNYVLTGEDVVAGRKFEDAIACCSAPIEDHHAGKDVRWHYVEGDGYYHIPYRCLMHGGPDNLLVAGRCLSATHDGQASVRSSAPIMAIGEAAGVAGALALADGVKPPALDYSRLRRALLDQGVILEPRPADPEELALRILETDPD
jgi:hypothetical protein